MEYSELRIIFFLSGLVVFTAMGILVPRRKNQKGLSSRYFNNIALGTFNPVVMKLILSISLLSWVGEVQEKGWGLLNQVEWPFFLEVLLVVVIFDGVIYWQHRFSHWYQPLWRLHRVHHSDPEFDSTTAIRFHFLEIILSFGLKLGAVAVFGGPILGAFAFEVVLNFSAMFNHSNWSLPLGLDRLLRKVIVTPDFHRVHHSVYRNETDSNYGFFLSIWDHLFGTYISQPKDGHDDMKIGMGLFGSEKEQRFLKMWTQPFRKS